MSIAGLTRIITTDENNSLPQTAGVIQRVYNTSVIAITITYEAKDGTTASRRVKAGHKTDFLYDGSEWTVSPELTMDDLEKIRSGNIISTETLDVYITTQEGFDTIFGGTIEEDASIFIHKLDGDTPYLLNYTVTLPSGVHITSDGAVVNRGTETARFVTTYKNSASYSSGGAVGDTTIVRGAGTPFEEGEIISWSHSEFYTVVSDTTTMNTGGTVTISQTIHEAPASGTIYAYTQNIHTEGWTFDGRNDVNNLGGSFTTVFPDSGGAFYIPYCAESQFLAGVRNCRVTSYGGAYYGSGYTYNNTMANIENCFAANYGGGCSGCDYSTISNINSCHAEYSGGGCHSCDYSTISKIIDCSSGYSGGGCYECRYSTISEIINCSAANDGGGCYDCSYCTISRITNCSAGSSGGGFNECNYSTISEIINCSAVNGGGGYNFYSCSVSKVINCSAGENGGGCYLFSLSTISDINHCSAGENGGGIGGGFYSNISEINYCSAGLMGGGCYYAAGSTISEINHCSAGENGGGCYLSFGSNISNVSNCSAENGGAGCFSCLGSTISNVIGCTASASVTDASGGVQNSTYITLQGHFDNEGYVDNIGGCTYIGQFTYRNNEDTDIVVTTTDLTSDNCN